MNYSVAIYYDQDTQRERYGVYCRTTQVWYFANQYGYKAAMRLCKRLNAL